jgi:hypothetical protein
MKSLNLHRKPISMFVTIAFTVMLCFWANQTPAAPASPAPENSSAASLENSGGESTGFIEQAEPEYAIKKGKKFPWLIAALVVVAGGAALYFLVLKKKNYTLTVTVGEGVSGTPAAGTSTNKKGTAIAYNYALQSGYSNLTVTLDGAPVSASGTVTMNANHTLAASATLSHTLTVIKGDHVVGTPDTGTYPYAQGTNVPYSYTPASGYSNLEVKIDGAPVAAAGTIVMNANHTLTATLYGANLEVNSNPPEALIYLDGVNSGHYTPYTFTFPTAVTKTVLLRYFMCGYKEYHQTVSVSMGETKSINPTLAAGIMEDFDVSASSCWQPSHSGWSTGSGIYKFNGTAPKWTTNVYNASFNSNFTLYAKLNRRSGYDGGHGVFLGTSNSVTDASGYLFYYRSNSSYIVYRMTNYNFMTNTGTFAALKSGSSSAIKAGANKWNLIRIDKSGNSYTIRVNTGIVTSFTDAVHNPSYCVVIFACFGVSGETYVEYVYLNPGSGAVEVPYLPGGNRSEDKGNSIGNPRPGEDIN